jgi:pyrroloquinoline quinone (PQQ) biosynthesis protein C
MNEFTNSISELAKGTRHHRALNNAFYDKWLGGRLTFDEAEVFLVNYCAWIETVIDHIARVFIATGDLEAKCETIKNLFSEMGCGNPEKAHITLLRKFAVGLLAELRGAGAGVPYVLPRTRTSALILPSTRALIDGQTRLFGNPAPQVAAGALLAQEWQAFTMLAQLYEGARLYMPQWKDSEDFHEICEYFYIHIGEAEKEHKIQSINSAGQYVHSADDFAVLRDGYATFLDLLADFWHGIATQMDQVDQVDQVEKTEARPIRSTNGAVASV